MKHSGSGRLRGGKSGGRLSEGRYRGSILMETVIVLPLLTALIFGALQMAHIHAARQVVSYAAYAAVRATLPLAEKEEKQAAEKAARRVLCWLVAVPGGMRDGVLMPDPDARAVKDRLLEFNLKQDGYDREAELKFAFPLVMPLAAQIIAFRMDPNDYTAQSAEGHISTRKFDDGFEGPHLILHERMSMHKPYKVKN